MKRIALLMSALACVALSAALSVQAENEEADESEETIALADVPERVQQAIKRVAGDANVTEVEKEDDHGLTLYEAAWKDGDVEHEVVVNATGAVMETEQVVNAKQVPKAVRDAAAKHLPKSATPEFERKRIILYEVEAMVDGKEVGFLVDPSGRIMELEISDDDDDDDERRRRRRRRKR